MKIQLLYTCTYKGCVLESGFEGIGGSDKGQAVRVAVDRDVRGGVLHPFCQLFLDIGRDLQLSGVVSLESFGGGGV